LIVKRACTCNDAKKSVDGIKKDAVRKQKELKQVHKGQLTLLARDHGEAIKMTKTKAKADVKVVIEKGDQRLD